MTDTYTTQIDDDVRMILTADETIDQHQLSVPEDDAPFILFDAVEDGGEATVLPGGKILDGEGRVVARLDPALTWEVVDDHVSR